MATVATPQQRTPIRRPIPVALNTESTAVSATETWPSRPAMRIRQHLRSTDTAAAADTCDQPTSRQMDEPCPLRHWPDSRVCRTRGRTVRRDNSKHRLEWRPCWPVWSHIVIVNVLTE
jgi:hypothetical protein